MTKQQNKTGRPPITFSPVYVEMAHNYCLLGADDAQLAKFFNVPASTIDKWKKDYPDFAGAIKSGRIMADAEVAASLYRRATGYQETEVTTREIKSPSGEVVSIETVTVTRHLPPDTAACIFWLKNRQPTLWHDKLEVEYTDKREPKKTDSDTSSPSTADKENSFV